MKKQSFLKGAAIIAAGGFIAKLIGALYRIPLTNLIGGYGMGLYQMVYPFYCLLLTVSATGIPSSIAKMVAERRAQGVSGKPVLKSAFLLFLLIGAFGTVLMMGIAPLLSRMQDCPEVKNGYLALAPSVLLVSAISVFRGWFQGENNMLPTALSEVTEQVVKVGFGLLFAYLFRSDVQKAVTYILLSVSISEACALLLMALLYRRAPAPLVGIKDGGRVSLKSVLRLSIPVTLSAALLPLSSLFDSVIIVRLLKRYTAEAVTLYGLFYGIAAASVPAVSAASAVPAGDVQGEAEKSRKNARRRMLYALLVTLVVSVPCALGLFFFAGPAVRIIFRALKPSEAETLVKLVRLFSVSAVTLSCTQTLSACLTGIGKPTFAAVSMAVAVAVKTILNFALVSSPKISVYGAAIAADVCYLVAFALDLVYNLIVTKRKKGDGKHDHGSRTGRGSGGFDGAGQAGDPVGKEGGGADGADPLV